MPEDEDLESDCVQSSCSLSIVVDSSSEAAVVAIATCALTRVLRSTVHAHVSVCRPQTHEFGVVNTLLLNPHQSLQSLAQIAPSSRIAMNSAGFYKQGSSITNSLSGESAYTTPPNSHPRFVSGHPSFRQQSFVQPDIAAVDQKLDRLLAMVMEQKETGAYLSM